MKKKQIFEVTYSFDDLNVLGVHGKDVFLKGKINFEFDCVILISKQLFKKSLDLWLRDNKVYCERWGHFCGNMGSIRALDYKKVDQIELDEQELNLYKINTIEKFGDIEHG